MAQVKAIGRQALQKLLESVPVNLRKYTEAEAWVGAWFGGSSWEFATPCEIAASLTLLQPAEGNLYDLENAIRLHKALPSLTPVQAQDPRLWTRLSHVELWKYMRARWPVERFLQNPDVAVGRIRERYFVAQRQSRALMRNGAARLWWAAKLTFDPDRDNAYELTHILLTSLDIAKNLLERNFGRAPMLTRTFLDFLLRNKDECINNGNASRLIVRHLTKALNLHGGICVLDSMTRKQIVAFLSQEMGKAVKNLELAAVGEGTDSAEDDES